MRDVVDDLRTARVRGLRTEQAMTTDGEPDMARHPSTEGLLRWLKPNENLPVQQLAIAGAVYDLAITLVNELPDDGAELSAGLRKLLEAKDCFVRASLDR